MEYIIIGVILIVLMINIFVFLLSIKIQKLEKLIINLFNKRNNQVVTLYGISGDTLNRKQEIFKNFFDLKRKDFGEYLGEEKLEIKMEIYKQIHNEINFIFSVCEKHPKISVNPFYAYIKDSILEKSNEIGNYYKLYKNIKKKYLVIKTISNLTIIGLFIK